MMIFHKKYSSGISLIEVIIALAMISIVVTILITTQGKAFESGLQSVDEQKIMLLLRRKWSELEMKTTDSNKPFTQDLGEEYPGGTVRYTVQPMIDKNKKNTRYHHMYAHILEATWTNRTREKKISFVRYRYHAPEPETQQAAPIPKDAAP